MAFLIYWQPIFSYACHIGFGIWKSLMLLTKEPIFYYIFCMPCPLIYLHTPIKHIQINTPYTVSTINIIFLSFSLKSIRLSFLFILLLQRDIESSRTKNIEAIAIQDSFHFFQCSMKNKKLLMMFSCWKASKKTNFLLEVEELSINLHSFCKISSSY